MFGHKWEAARGTIVESRVEQTTVAGEPGLHQVRVYVIDVRRPHGQPLRATVPSPHGVSTDLAPGVMVRLEVNAKTGEVRFDPSAPAPTAHAASVRDAMRLARDMRGEAGGAAIAAALAGLGQGSAGQLPGAGTPGVHVVGGEQLAELMQSLLAGGGDRAAALEKIRQLKADLQAQAAGPQSQTGPQGQTWTQGQTGPPGPAGPDSLSWTRGQHGPPGPASLTGQAGVPAAGSVGFSSPDGPSTFDPATPSNPVPPVTPAATFSSPADSFGVPTSSVGPPGGSVSFSSPAVAPAAFEPVTPAGSFGSPGGGSFSAGGTFDTFGQNSKSDRIARLEDQRDRGQLTQQQFEVQHQQILDEI